MQKKNNHRGNTTLIRLKYLEAILCTIEEITGEHYRKIFGIGTAQQTRDFNEYRKKYQPGFQYDPVSGTNKVNFGERQWQESWWENVTPEEYIDAIHIVFTDSEYFN